MSQNGFITIKAGLLPGIKTQLDAVFSVTPPMPQPGKYYLAKAAQAVATELPLYLQQKLDLLKKHAPKDAQGEPVLTSVDQGNGQTAVSINPVDPAAFAAEDRALFDAPVVLTGVPRLLTATDIGECPVPNAAYAALLGVLFADEPPPGA